MFSNPSVILPPTVTTAVALQLLGFVFLGRDVMAEMVRDQLHEHLTYQAGLARAGDAGHSRKYPDGKGDAQLVQVIARHAGQAQPAPGARGARRFVACRAKR